MFGSADIASAILTAGGNAFFSSYVKRVTARQTQYQIRSRRWKDPAWSTSVTLALESTRINHLSAPQFSPASYAALFWDQHFATPADPSQVKSLRVPNN